MPINPIFLPVVLLVASCGAPVVTTGVPGSPQRAPQAQAQVALQAPLSSSASRDVAGRLPSPPAAAKQAMARCVNSDQKFSSDSDAPTINRKNSSGMSMSDVLVAWGQLHFGDRAYCFIPGDGFAMRKPDWRFLFTEWQKLLDAPATGAITSAQVARLAEFVTQSERVAQSVPTENRARRVSDPFGAVRLEVPAGWRDWMAGQNLFVGAESGFPRFVVTSDLKQSGSLADYARSGPGAIQKFYRSLTVVRQTSVYRSPLWNGLTTELAGESSGTGEPERLVLFFLPCRDRYVSLIARDRAGSIESNRRVIEDFANAASCI